jgi:hypothetical protein
MYRAEILCLLLNLGQPEPATPVEAPAAPAPAPATTPASGDAAEIEKALASDASAGPPAPAPAADTPPPPAGAAGSSMNPDLSLIADFALAAFSADQPLQGGDHDPTRRGFNLQQLEMSLGKAVDPYFRFDANIVFGQDDVEVEEAYGTTLSLPWNLQLRAGQFLTRFGRINPTHPHAWDFVDQPLVMSRVFGGEGNRGLGAELSVLAPLPWYVELVLSQSDAAGEGTARSFYGAMDLGVSSPLDLQTTAALKQFFPLSDDLSLAWGLSAAVGPNSSGPDRRTDVYGTDVYLKFRPISYGSYTIVALTAEWLYRRRQIPQDVLDDFGGYTSLFWRFAQRWAAAVRHEYGSPSRNRAGAIAADPLDPDWTEARQRWTASVTFWPTEFSRLRLQGSADRPGWTDTTNWASFLAVEFVVGAHGAHKF